MRIAAVADIHYPRFFPQFEKSLSQIDTPDVFLLAGDIVNRGKADGYPIVIDAIESIHGTVPVVACFGNEDYNMFHNEHQILELVGNRVIFLDNSTTSLSIDDSTLGFLGVSIVSERAKDVDEIRTLFEEQTKRISNLLTKLSTAANRIIALTHYSPLSETELTFSWWFDEAVQEIKPSLVVHGHIHESTRNRVMVESTPVYNVALPAVGSITEIDI